MGATQEAQETALQAATVAEEPGEDPLIANPEAQAATFADASASGAPFCDT